MSIRNPVTVADLIDALRHFPPDALVGNFDYMSSEVLCLVAPVLNSGGIVVIGTGDRYTGVVGRHYCNSDCDDRCEE